MTYNHSIYLAVVNPNTNPNPNPNPNPCLSGDKSKRMYGVRGSLRRRAVHVLSRASTTSGFGVSFYDLFTLAPL